MAHRPKLKILLDRPSNAEAHAQELIANIDTMDRKNTYEPKPRNVPYYSALVPERCDDCGETYWTRQGAQWTSHLDCSGAPKKGGNAGF